MMRRLLGDRSGGAVQDFALAGAFLAALAVVGAGFFERSLSDRSEITGSIRRDGPVAPASRPALKRAEETGVWATLKGWMMPTR